MAKKVLIVEDEVAIAELEKDYLEADIFILIVDLLIFYLIKKSFL